MGFPDGHYLVFPFVVSLSNHKKILLQEPPMKKERQKTETWAEFYDRGSILDQIMEEPIEFGVDRKVQKDILTKKRKRKLQNVTLKMDPLQIVTIRKLAAMKSIPYQTLIRHWLSDKIRKELSLP